MKLSNKIGSTVKVYENIEEIPEAFEFGRKYRYDQLFGSKSDHLTHPARLQWRLDNNFEFGDCDDHAIYWCATLLKSKLAKRVWFAHYSMKRMTEENNFHREGHAVCVFEGLDGELYWADYRKPKKITNISEFMHESARAYRSQPVVGAIWEVKGLKDNDTPKFGKITRLIP